MDLDQLRQATRTEHEATEALVPLMHPDLSLQQYAHVLQRFRTVVCAWETWAAAHAPAELRPLLAARQRCGLIDSDLRYLSASVPPSSGEVARDFDALAAGADEEENHAGFLGAMYVVEGSTLGGQYISRHLRQHFGWTDGNGDRYFQGHGSQTMPMWREFQAVLSAVPQEQADTVIQAAREMFALFARHLAPAEILSAP